MKAGYFIVEGKECFVEISDMLEKELKKHLRTDIIDGYLFFVENFSYANSSDLMTVIRLEKIDKNENNCEVEIVSGGGGKGLFSMTWGNESRRLNNALNLITEFCQVKQFKYSAVAYKK